MTSGRTLRDLRRRAGLTQAAVSRRVGIPITVLSAYENGRRQPAADTAARIVDAMGYRVEYVPRPDAQVQAHRLAEVLALADALPYRPRPQAVARR